MLMLDSASVDLDELMMFQSSPGENKQSLKGLGGDSSFENGVKEQLSGRKN
jgi:hypothetical protein